jgi:hypothetical protein
VPLAGAAGNCDVFPVGAGSWFDETEGTGAAWMGAGEASWELKPPIDVRWHPASASTTASPAAA